MTRSLPRTRSALLAAVGVVALSLSLAAPAAAHDGRGGGRGHHPPAAATRLFTPPPNSGAVEQIAECLVLVTVTGLAARHAVWWS